MTTRVSVVIPTHERAARWPALISALEAQTLESTAFEVVIVDDASTDDTAEVLAKVRERTPLQVEVVRLPTNRRQAHARNVGWRRARAPVVAFTDDDCEPGPRWLEAGLAALATRDDIGLVQGRTVPAQLRRRTFSATREVRELNLLFEGCNLFLRREALADAGGFDERFTVLCEDASMCWTVLEAGWQAVFAPDAVVAHAVTRPPLRFHLRERWREHNLVRLARLHPRFRRDVCWRPWCIRVENARFLLAVGGVVLARRHPVALVTIAPWIRDRWPPGRVSRAALTHVAKRAACDAVGAAAMIAGSVRNRTLLL